MPRREQAPSRFGDLTRSHRCQLTGYVTMSRLSPTPQDEKQLIRVDVIAFQIDDRCRMEVPSRCWAIQFPSAKSMLRHARKRLLTASMVDLRRGLEQGGSFPIYIKFEQATLLGIPVRERPRPKRMFFRYTWALQDWRYSLRRFLRKRFHYSRSPRGHRR